MLGVTLRSVALPIGLGVVWVLGIENLVSAMASNVLTALRPVRDVLPGVNAGSLVSAVLPDRVIDPPPGVTASVAQPRALITLVCYLAACAAVAAWSTRRRDVASGERGFPRGGAGQLAGDGGAGSSSTRAISRVVLVW